MDTSTQNTSTQFNEDELERYPTFEEALQQLSSNEGHMPDPDILYGLSGLVDSQIRDFQKVWVQMDPTQRQLLLQMMIDASYSNLELDFEPVGIMVLQDDADTNVRRTAVELLFESESRTAFGILHQILMHDQDLPMQVNATRALGNFVLLATPSECCHRHGS